jgi:hypothetical protein
MDEYIKAVVAAKVLSKEIGGLRFYASKVFWVVWVIFCLSQCAICLFN